MGAPVGAPVGVGVRVSEGALEVVMPGVGVLEASGEAPGLVGPSSFTTYPVGFFVRTVVFVPSSRVTMGLLMSVVDSLAVGYMMIIGTPFWVTVVRGAVKAAGSPGTGNNCSLVT